MFKIQTLNKISPRGLDRFPHDSYEIATEFSHPDAVLVRSANMLETSFADTVKAIGRAGAGVNNIPVDRCSKSGIVVFNTPGANANAVKELAILSLLISSRKVVDSVLFLHQAAGKGEELSKLVEKNKSLFVGPEVLGKKLGIIGLGAIGVMVANSALALGMEVEGHDPFITVDAAWSLSKDIKKAKGIDRLIATSDYISLHVPQTEKTKGFLNEEKISRMKKGVRIINLSRGGIVDEKAVIAAIKSGQISCYVTDFASDALLSTENVICFPHLGASTPEAEENCALMIVDQVKDFLENGNIRNSVNFPAITLERQGERRLTIINRNVPNMVGQFSTVLADAKINILEMINKSQNELAYNILDIEGPLSEEVIKKLNAIEGVIKIREIVIPV
ncbi:MAG: 3-phosphoglycerate dehydrogenase [Elusimicrobia bacterium RIFOXYB2_FULL_49_7]|nr:MAG: 3-phosphoglycerate dehydrogenase [Elusimicrobia bacterium RIFOXYB2_FULL_49_7]